MLENTDRPQVLALGLQILAEVSRNLGEPMVGRQISSIPEPELIAQRGW